MRNSFLGSGLLHLLVALKTLWDFIVFLFYFYFFTKITKADFFHLLQKGQGAPAREPLLTDEQHKQMMLHYHRRQEELKVRKG